MPPLTNNSVLLASWSTLCVEPSASSSFCARAGEKVTPPAGAAAAAGDGFACYRPSPEAIVAQARARYPGKETKQMRTTQGHHQ